MSGIRWWIEKFFKKKKYYISHKTWQRSRPINQTRKRLQSLESKKGGISESRRQYCIQRPIYADKLVNAYCATSPSERRGFHCGLCLHFLPLFCSRRLYPLQVHYESELSEKNEIVQHVEPIKFIIKFVKDKIKETRKETKKEGNKSLAAMPKQLLYTERRIVACRIKQSQKGKRKQRQQTNQNFYSIDID